MAPSTRNITIRDLSAELIHEISAHLLFPHLEDFAASRLCFARVTQSRLRKHQQLHRRYNVLDGPGADEPLGWFGILCKVLKQEIPVEYIEELKIHNGEWYFNELPAWKEGTEPEEGDMKLVERAAKDSPWITENDACGPGANARNMTHFLEEIREGDQDVGACVPCLDLPLYVNAFLRFSFETPDVENVRIPT